MLRFCTHIATRCMGRPLSTKRVIFNTNHLRTDAPLLYRSSKPSTTRPYIQNCLPDKVLFGEPKLSEIALVCRFKRLAISFVVSLWSRFSFHCL